MTFDQWAEQNKCENCSDYARSAWLARARIAAEREAALRNLVNALDRAFISTWQSTAAWQKELDIARAALCGGMK